MTNKTKNFYHYFLGALTCVAAIALITDSAFGAAVVARNSRARQSSASSAPAASVSTTAAAPTQTQTVVAPAPAAEPEPVIIEDKSKQFSAALGDTGGNLNNTTTASDSELAEMIRRQRASLDAADAIDSAKSAAEKSMQTGANSCDAALRTCMAQKCGTDFTKCSGDTDMTWGDKMDTCRRDTNCTGREYQLFSAEIKADRDTNAALAGYNAIIECGSSYNECIITQCGQTFGKCLGKKAGDKAISDCAKIAQRCTQQDSGLAARAMDAFGTLRQAAEKQVAADEQRLYALRDQMRSQCEMLGAMFDERTFDCVYTVNFFAGDSATPYASKKTYAGTSFDCTPNWFGIDVTTFKENAYRYAREQSSATSAMLGAGVGVAGGAISSGAIDRAIDRQKAKNALKEAQKQHDAAFGKTTSDKPETDTPSNNNIIKDTGSKTVEQAGVQKLQDLKSTLPAVTSREQQDLDRSTNILVNKMNTEIEDEIAKDMETIIPPTIK